MDNRMAFCGIDCLECPTYLATQTDDDQARLQVAELWSRQFGLKLEKEDINCQGCRGPEGRTLFGHCQHCAIRSCADGKGHETCAQCASYPCPDLEQFFAVMPLARQNLDRLRELGAA